jgi:hypothetical protein
VDTERLDALRDELRSRERMTLLLGLDIERPIRSVVDGYPENAVTLVGKAAERVLKEVWIRQGVPGDPSSRALNDLIKGTRDHIDRSGVLDSLADIQRLRNRSAHDGYEVAAEDAYLALRRLVTILEWFESSSAGRASAADADVVLNIEVEERLQFVVGLHSTLGYSLAKRFNISSTTSYVLFERVVGLKSDYIEVLLGTSTDELAAIISRTEGLLLRTSYPKVTRFVLVHSYGPEVSGLPTDSKVLTYQDFLDTIVDSSALAEVAAARASAIEKSGVGTVVLEGDLLTIDPTLMSFDTRHVVGIADVVRQACESSSTNLLVIGAAGTGKTRLLTELAAAHVSDGRYRFFLDLSDRRPAELVEDLVVRQLGRCFSVPRTQVWPVFVFLIRSGRCLCLVDAIDEAVDGGSLDATVELFGDLSVLLSAASTTVITCRQSFLLDTHYVRQLLDERALVSEKLAGRLAAEGVDPLSLPRFSVLRISGVAGQGEQSPLRLVLQAVDDDSLLVAVFAELSRACGEAGLSVDRLVDGLGLSSLHREPSLTVLDLLGIFGGGLFDSVPSLTSCRLRRILVPVDGDRLRFRHQVFREAVAAKFLHRHPEPRLDLHGIKVTDQTRSFLAELGQAGTGLGPDLGGRVSPGNYLIGPPGEVCIHVLTDGLVASVNPVSVAEYRAFLRAAELGEVSTHPVQPVDDGIDPWLDRLRLPDYYSSSEYDDFPATCVSWWGAWAYARWKGTRLLTSTEWELAARGPDGRLFPWGDAPEIGAVNCADHWAGRLLPTWQEWRHAHDRGELRSGYPTLPGSLVHNCSPSGCRDMAGNVWEWTSTLLPDGETAVIAGGSYDNPIRAVRCSSRGVYRLGGRSNVVGFRVLAGWA